ncbi:hypothetical protein [Mycobacteroides abscessus]
MTAWFKRQRPETTDVTEQSEPGVEAPTIDLGLFVARLEAPHDLIEDMVKL